jgi:hypothetical protein
VTRLINPFAAGRAVATVVGPDEAVYLSPVWRWVFTDDRWSDRFDAPTKREYRADLRDRLAGLGVDRELADPATNPQYADDGGD